MAFETVAKATIRENVFNTVATLLDNNKLGGWTVLASFPGKKPVFPVIVVNPAKISIRNISLDRSKDVRTVEVVIDVYTKSHASGKEEADQGIDNVTDTLTQNNSTLLTYNLSLSDTPIIDDDHIQLEHNRQIFNLRSLTVLMTARI